MPEGMKIAQLSAYKADLKRKHQENDASTSSTKDQSNHE